ncbi:Uncharacterized conserved protein, DUF305 family [Quadrisphaera granulorum]|uniref:Uncharacterized protein (DUF305 family) n=1 Tax=Quadrisphaera granulorum TaxID=317664 RepID=A0A316ADE7_9ACTN|nr:DUF305 domain-containing protein [Quadrisphaera granulorum]PWJ54904.1 uncharacterized protein (DUF305 family) [Quadrisphaera granulorum]SZE95850.1 Uncharacterized conserved protein, DUF305 family [Quadrisphaera granulorum]
MPSSTRPATNRTDRSTRRTTARSAALLLASAATALLLAGCGASSSGAHHDADDMQHGSSPAASAASPSSSSISAGASAHSDADVSFARDMVVHHEGALTMAELATQRASTPEVKALAERIMAAQQPEIDLMQGWLTAWGADPSSQHSGHSGMDMDSMGMSADDTAALQAATGTAFDRLFLQQMTVHHEGAVTMARQELAEGTDAEAKALAQRIEADQTAEIAEMAALLAQLPA